MLGMKGQRPGRRSLTRAAGVGILVLSLFAATACSAAADAATPQRRLTVLANGQPVKPDAAPPRLAIAPAADATGVSPTDPVTVNATNATLSAVTLTGPDGKE